MPKKVDQEKRKIFITEATFRVIKRYGIENTTVRKVAEEAGLSLGSVQYYFPVQRDLYIFAMELLLKRTEERIVRSVKNEKPTFENVVSMLKPLIPSKDEEHRMEIEGWLNFALMAMKDPSLEIFSKKIYQSTLEFMDQTLKILQKNGYIDDSFNFEIEAVNLYTFIDGLTLQAILYPELFDDEIIERRIEEYLRKISTTI